MSTKKQSRLKRALEIHSIITGVALLLFFVFSLVSMRIQSGDFVSSKYHAANPAAVFSQRIWGTPAQPVVVLTQSCESTGARVAVDWEEDENATSYDIFRNGSTLVTGLASSIYFDDNVDDSTTYLYYVTANGPAGSETSDIESVTTAACGGSAPEQISVVTFDGQNVQNPAVVYDTTNRRPLITGTSTIENALIDIQLHGAATSFALTNANNTGYWHWTPVSNLSYGDYAMYLTATDPLDNSNIASTVFSFEIEREDEEEDDEDKGETALTTTTIAPTVETEQQLPTIVEPKPEAEKPVDFSIVVINEYGKVTSGEYLGLRLVILDVAKDYQDRQAQLNVSIVDAAGQELDRDSFDLRLYGGQRLEKRMMISCPGQAGSYLIRAEILVDQKMVSEEAVVDVEQGKDCAGTRTGLETSLVGGELGTICAFTDWLGWLVIILLLILLILIFLFLILTRRKSKADQR